MFITIVSGRFSDDAPDAERAYMSHPVRHVNGPPKPLILPQCVWMNRPTDNKDDRLTPEK